MSNEELKAKYDEMHKQGASAWYGDGREERETILKMGEPNWDRWRVLEIGCGEGDLGKILWDRNRNAYHGIDYSQQAIINARSKYPKIPFTFSDYRTHDELNMHWDCLVMQGVLEHLDDPFGELQWMIEHFKPKTVITSSPCFLNPRGIVWMTLDMLGAVMSKTDLHYLNPWDFKAFCEQQNYKLSISPCDTDWGWDNAMRKDLKQRIPLACKDGGLTLLPSKLDALIEWLGKASEDFFHPIISEGIEIGATMVYRMEV